MKYIVVGFMLFFLVLVLSSNCSTQNDFPVLTGPYLGQKPPSKRAEIFMDGIISTRDKAEMCAAFTDKGREFFFNARPNNNWMIFTTREIKGKWLKPEPLSFSSEFTDRDFTISPDGNSIYFGSNRPPQKGGKGLKSLDIFVTKRIRAYQWSDPENLGKPINTNFGENYPSIAGNGNLYFFSCREDGLGGCDIYMARFVKDEYLSPENMGRAVNSEKNDWDACIAPDESFIIFSSQNREDSLGGQDIYISYRKNNGHWTRAKNMGPAVNSPYCEICPSVSLDGKYLFFTSRRRGKADIYWIKAEIIEDLKPKESK